MAKRWHKTANSDVDYCRLLRIANVLSLDSLPCQVCSLHRCVARASQAPIVIQPGSRTPSRYGCTGIALRPKLFRQRTRLQQSSLCGDLSCRGRHHHQQHHWQTRPWLLQLLPGPRAWWRWQAGPQSGTLCQSREIAAASVQMPAVQGKQRSLISCQNSAEGTTQTVVCDTPQAVRAAPHCY